MVKCLYIIIIIIISFMQGIYTYIHETNFVPREYSVAAIMLYYSWCYIVSSSVESIVLLHKYFPKYVCSAQYGCFLEFLDFMFSRYVAHVFSE